ncbi:FdhF/YdeP family oxidoreductase [Streptomyces sp. FXJ1.172]|uniref:FdhF/YdeP family oxidoreductase n=1 Tax=Streptomyces sp. FXJ1.172 TaxID=710705 RepID=UPI0007CF96E1|nr:FdhF/YdeP family oxidoreductase [Streptomyces sp. FXJ1.172]WEO96317.1 FdhF/YdeP family oxidoreductase [Streptomyces sp. FXJ1.172]
MAERPADPSGTGTSGPRKSSAGIHGITESARYSLSEMGPRRSLQTLLAVNQADGFDCPSCAWGEPGPEHRKTAEFCENGVKAVAWEATRKRVDATFFAEHSVAGLRERDGHWLESQGRLAQPMHLAPGATHYTPITWDDALALVAGRLRRLPDPNRAVFYTSGRTSNEAAFLYQLLARRYGTNNLPDCSNMCHESSGTALSETIGVGKGLIAYDDITEHADLIIIAGQNPGTSHPRMLTALEQAKRRGARIIAANPLPEAGFGRFRNPQTPRGLIGPGTRLADRCLPVRVNGDLALFAGLNRALIDAEDAAPGSVLDHDFIDRYCDGFEEAAAAWRALDWPLIETLSGLSRRHIRDCAADVRAARSVIVCWAMGLTQHRNSVATIREIVDFLLLRGNIGRPGAGPAPIRGHSNVQGDRTMGIGEQMPDTFLDALRDEFGFDPPRAPGLDTVDAIRAMRDGRIDVFVGLGGNFAAAAPDTTVTEAALARCALTVHIATKLNRSHLCHGTEALLLPCLGRTERDRQAGGEQFVTVEDTMAMVHASRGRILPGSPHLRSEVAIVADLGRALFGDGLGWRAMRDDYTLIRRHIEHVVPGFHAFEERIRRPGGFMLPRPPRDSRTFPTDTGKAHFTVNPPTAAEVPPGHLLLTTVRSHDQFNTTVYGLDDRYRGITGGRRVVFLNRDDLRDLHLHDGDLVDLVSVNPDGERRAAGFRAVRYPTPRGCAAAYYPEANTLAALDSTAEASNTPATKSIVIRVEPAAAGPGPRPHP